MKNAPTSTRKPVISFFFFNQKPKPPSLSAPFRSLLSWSVSEMLLKLKYATAALGWVLTRLQAHAFSVVGFQKLSNTAHHHVAVSLPSTASTSPSTPRTLAAAAWSRPPSRGLLALHMSTGGDAVESSLGTTSEERSVLDALIDQFTSPKSGNVTATVEEYLDLCDHAFLTHLRRRIEAEEAESPKVRAQGRSSCLPHSRHSA